MLRIQREVKSVLETRWSAKIMKIIRPFYFQFLLRSQSFDAFLVFYYFLVKGACVERPHDISDSPLAFDKTSSKKNLTCNKR